MKKELLFLLLGATATTGFAQRNMDQLDRGLVAVKTSTGVFLSWRIDGTEYYDTQYNLYRDGVKVNTTPLSVSNFVDASGSTSSTYTVKAIVRGVEGSSSAAASVWSKQYLSVPMKPVISRAGEDISSQYILNDVSTADLDGDGQYEILVKRLYLGDGLFYEDATDYSRFEAYKLDGTQLWSIDMGPNLVSSGHVESNIVAYDWDQDGKAEVILRAADGTIITDADGNKTTVGSATANYRNYVTHSGNMTYMTAGPEFLLYMEGATGKLYNEPMEFPLKRLEAGETDLNAAWGDGYGHRCNKFFFGAPYLDGRKPSIFLGRGIYTRHKMVALDVDPATHKLTERWRWTSDGLGGEWFGEGYHNYGIADVDLDGRDEIVYGSMVIDDNGKGLSSTGLGHGDAQHCSDLDPYRYGQEIFACNEDAQGANLRNATTSKLYYWFSLGRDCGRAMAGNFTDDYLGAQCIASGSPFISATTGAPVNGGACTGVTQDFRIYWDGDLCEETLDGIGTEGAAGVYKYGQAAAIFTATGTKMCNWTKNTPSGQVDIFGDWREEIIGRAEDNQSLMIYTTVDPTPWRNYTLLHDHQYRQAMVWQMCGYNQPPHVSYFLGQAEGITMAPPPVMTNGRVEATTQITTAMNDKHVMLANTAGGTVEVATGAQPYILTVNAFSHTQGSNNNDNITTTKTDYILNGSLSGATRLVKQGEGNLYLNAACTHTGLTDIWGGSVYASGDISNSHIWINRFAQLWSQAKTIDLGQCVSMEYGATLGATEVGSTITIDSLSMNFGACLHFNLNNLLSHDVIKLNKALILKNISTADGPQYLAPVIKITRQLTTDEPELVYGDYVLIETPKLEGDLSKVKVEGLEGVSFELKYENNQVILTIHKLRDSAQVYWNGTDDNRQWDLNNTVNFNLEGNPTIFVTGDDVIFDDAASSGYVNVKSDVHPNSVTFKNDEKQYVLSGESGIAGDATVNFDGTGEVVFNSNNIYTGKTTISGGTVSVSSLANSLAETGSLGKLSTEKGHITLKNGGALSNMAIVTNGTPIAVEKSGVIDAQKNFYMQAAFSGDTLVKTGTGALNIAEPVAIKRIVIKEGGLEIGNDNNLRVGDTIVFAGTNTFYTDFYSTYSYSNNANNFKVEKGATATIWGDPRCNYTGKLTGQGYLKVNAPDCTKAIRCYFDGDWSQFEGTVEPINTAKEMCFRNGYGLPKATLHIPAGVGVVGDGNKTFVIGKLTGTGTLFGGHTWAIGKLGEDFTFEAHADAEGMSMQKVGDGCMTVKTTNAFTGAFAISGGSVKLSNNTAELPMLGTGSMIVYKGGELSGSGLLGNSMLTFKSGSTLRPGSSVLPGELRFSGKNVTLDSGSELIIRIYSGTLYSKLTDLGTLKISGDITLSMRDDLADKLEIGDELQVFDAQKITINSKLELPALSATKAWDTSELATRGVLKVTEATGINGINANEEVTCQVFLLNGKFMGTVQASIKNLAQELKQAGYAQGAYMVKITVKGDNFSQKVIVD